MKKNNKKTVIIFAIFFTIGAFIGVSFFNTTYGANWYNEEPTSKTNNSETQKEQTDISKEIDTLFQTNTSINLEDIISSSNYGYGNDYLGAMYQETIKDEYKVLYAVNSKLTNPIYVGEHYYERFDTYICSLYGYKTDSECMEIQDITFQISLQTLNNLVSKIFADTTISNNFKASTYNDINSITCQNDICSISITTAFRGKSYKNYLSNITNIENSEETGYRTYQVSTIYSAPLNDDVETIGLYETENSSLLTTVSKNVFQSMSFEDIEKLTNTSKKYTFTFDTSGRLVSNIQQS